PAVAHGRPSRNAPSARSGSPFDEPSDQGVSQRAWDPRVRNQPQGSEPRNEYRARSDSLSDESRKNGQRPLVTRWNKAIGSMRPTGRTVSRNEGLISSGIGRRDLKF